MAQLPLHTNQPLYAILEKEKENPYGLIEKQAEKKPNVPDIGPELRKMQSFESHVGQAKEDIQYARSDKDLQALHKAEIEEEVLVDEMEEAAEAVASLKEKMEEARKKANPSSKRGIEYIDKAFFLRTAYLSMLNQFKQDKQTLFKMVELSFMNSDFADEEALQKAEEIKKKITNAPEVVRQISHVAKDKDYPTNGSPVNNMKSMYKEMNRQIE